MISSGAAEADIVPPQIMIQPQLSVPPLLILGERNDMASMVLKMEIENLECRPQASKNTDGTLETAGLHDEGQGVWTKLSNSNKSNSRQDDRLTCQAQDRMAYLLVKLKIGRQNHFKLKIGWQASYQTHDRMAGLLIKFEIGWQVFSPRIFVCLNEAGAGNRDLADVWGFDNLGRIVAAEVVN